MSESTLISFKMKSTLKATCILAATVLMTLSQSLLAVSLDLTGTSKYYKIHPQFHPYPEEGKPVQAIDRFGPVGIGIHLVQPAFTMQVKNVEPGSPAEATGKLKQGQIIESINGRVMKDEDPREILGDILAKAEATDGVVKLVVRDKAEAPPEEVVVKIPVLGAHGATWPLNDAKSDKIVRGLADFVARSGPGNMGFGTLFLLSTGEEKDLEVVSGWMRKTAEENKSLKETSTAAWYCGYKGIGLCEYYLRTGDQTILHTIQLYVDYMEKTQHNGSWGHKGIGNCGYSSSGHLNAAGVHVLTFLLLAKECGADVDEKALNEALSYFFKFAGHGNVAYGDSTPESGFVDNGKTGGLAFGMQAAVNLTPEGEKSVYAKARDVSATKSFYSTFWLNHGHTGGGIGEIWRGAAMSLVAEKNPVRYREFVNARVWLYDLSRRFDGSFGIVGGGRYDTPDDWGVGMGLVYTLPRKHLRMAGAPVTKYSKTYQLPKRPWGNEADEVFYDMQAASVRGAKPVDADKETLREDGSWPVLRKLMAPDVTDDYVLRIAHHPELGVREYAMRTVVAKKRNDLVVELLKSTDPRVRQVAMQGISEMTDEIAALLLAMVEDPQESWWVTFCALEKLADVRAELLVPHKRRLLHWLQHEDWWMSIAAQKALTNLIQDKELAKEILPVIGEVISKSPYTGRIWLMEKMLRGADPEVQKLASSVLAKLYGGFPAVVVTPGGAKVDSAEPVQMKSYAWMLSRLPGGYDALYHLAKQRYPDKTLQHKELFLAADTNSFSDELREGMKVLIRENLIPEFIGSANHIASNRKLLLEETTSAVPFKGNYYYQRPRIDELVDFYRKLGSNDYEWHDFGPAIDKMQWQYHSFDPPEKYKIGDTAHYRKVTYPAGMENWFAKDFDADKAGWKSGLQPIGQIDGKLGTLKRGCRGNYCRCEIPIQSLWEKEVLLARGAFDFPKFKEGHRYRLVFGGMSHVGEGDGYRVYVNGKPIMERNRGTQSREGGIQLVYNLDKAWWPDFQNGDIVIAATGFLPSNGRNTMLIWVQEMKCPEIGEKEILESAKAVAMANAQWQTLQDPDNMELDPEQGKFRWGGTFKPNSKVMGSWVQIGEVPTVADFSPGKALRKNQSFPEKLMMADDGRTNDPLIFYSGDLVMHLNTNQALNLSLNDIDGASYLFVEAGGFATKNGPNYKSPLVVWKRE